jgi:hypothetical protein
MRAAQVRERVMVANATIQDATTLTGSMLGGCFRRHPS